MRWRVYAVRGFRVIVLGAGAISSVSCIARLGDLRPGLDAGPPRQAEVTTPVRNARDAGETEQRGSLGSSSSVATGAAAASGEWPSVAPSTLGDTLSTLGDTLSASDRTSEELDASAETVTSRSGDPSDDDAPWIDCPVGTAMSEVDAGQCIPCGPGGYCAGGTVPFIACDIGLWDPDADAATPCVDRRVCLPGQYVTNDGTATANRACADCAHGQYSDAANSPNCQAWSECLAPASYALSLASAESDRQCAPCPPLTSSLEDNASVCAIASYQMTNGQVVFEAEHPHVVSDTATDAWSKLELAEVSGGACMELGPDDRSDWTSDPFLTAPRLDYVVHFQNAGTYYIHVRGDAGANSEGFSDSCYAAVDGVVTDWYRFSVDGGTWAWASQTVVLESGGVHVVSILGREDGFRVDKVVVSASVDAPVGFGPPESATALTP